MKKIIFPSMVVLTLFSCSEQEQKVKKTAIIYPETKQGDVIDNYFGFEVRDPYRWLEDDRSAETEAWVIAQNKVTFGYLHAMPQREILKNRISALWNYEK